MLAVGNDELGEAIGSEIDCPRCGKMHPIEYGTSKRLQSDGTFSEPAPSQALAFYRCGDSLYLAGINGKAIKARGEDMTNSDNKMEDELIEALERLLITWELGRTVREGESAHRLARLTLRKAKERKNNRKSRGDMV